MYDESGRDAPIRTTGDLKYPLVLRQDQTKALVLTAVTGLFVVASVFVLSRGKLIGWVGTIFFGLCLVVALTRFIPGAYSLKGRQCLAALTAQTPTPASLTSWLMQEWSLLLLLAMKARTMMASGIWEQHPRS